MRPHLHPRPGPLTLAELAQPLSMMFRADPVLSGSVIERGRLAAAGDAQQTVDLDDTGMRGFHSGLQTRPLPRTSWRMVLLNQMAWPDSRSSQVLRKTMRGTSICFRMRR